MSLPLERVETSNPEFERAVELLQIEHAIGQLGELAVRDKGPGTGYTREAFGGGWDSVDGITARNMILNRDIPDAQMQQTESGLIIVSGVLIDPYSNDPVVFDVTEGRVSNIDIDHVVALKDAWIKGASEWKEEKRARFHNDPINLLAVSARLNRQKGSGDAATWLPENKHCRALYVARQIIVKTQYDLRVSPAEKQAMGRVMSEFTSTHFSRLVADMVEKQQIRIV